MRTSSNHQLVGGGVVCRRASLQTSNETLITAPTYPWNGSISVRPHAPVATSPLPLLNPGPGLARDVTDRADFQCLWIKFSLSRTNLKTAFSLVHTTARTSTQTGIQSAVVRRLVRTPTGSQTRRRLVLHDWSQSECRSQGDGSPQTLNNH